MQRQIWHIMTDVEICKGFRVEPGKGLSDKEVTRRLAEFGKNTLSIKKGINPVFLFLGQFKDFMVMVLMVATLISGLLGEIADAVTILAIVFVNAILGFIQEYRAERSMEALRSLAAPEAMVLRNNTTVRVPASELVPGDIVMLDAGDRIPADIRWLKTTNIRVEESALTGESQPTAKVDHPLLDEYLPIADRKNMGYMGTIVVNGRGLGVVVATGMDTEMGVIAGMIQEVQDEETPLQKRLAQLGKWLVTISVAVCVVVVITGILQGESFEKMFFAGVSLAVAAIPEGLPAIVTVALAIGVQRMVKRNAVIRKLPAVETLGCATVICSDKTGTLTQNEMTVRRIFCDNQIISLTGQGYDPKGEYHGINPYKEKGPLQELLKCAALCNNAVLTKKGVRVVGLFRGKNPDSVWGIDGDPTEGALLVAAAKAGIWREGLERKEQRVAEIPFESERKRMTVIYKSKDAFTAYVKGAADVILGLCTQEMTKDGVVPMTPERRKKILAYNDEMATHALRVLALAVRDIPKSDVSGEVEDNLTFLGLMGMIDPPRTSAIKAIKICQAAGIKPVMITGDHKLTAQAVAKELGIIKGTDEHVVTGIDLDQMSDDDLEHQVMDISVFARVAPRDKLRIVRAYKKNKQIVAMTGDGVNDAPAVKEADIGVAMGQTGTDVTKEASAMIISDDNFATIVAAVEEGRGIYDNIRKFIRYLLSCNLGEVLTMFLGTLTGLPLPLLPIQILWVNLVTDGLPAMALGVDGSEPDIMKRSPRLPGENVFAKGLGKKILIRGTIIGLGTLLVFVIGLFYGTSLLAARTMAFTTLVFSQLFHVFDCKSERRGIFEVGIFSNPLLVGAVAVSVTMQLCAIYLPFMQTIFKTTALTGWQWIVILLVAGGPSVIIGLIRMIGNAAKTDSPRPRLIQKKL
ncbi:calcium-transporting P-type ATPase, PMR1-type [Dehalobacter sp. DCM]|uniref:calcium-transporting P-type ATPase, PMR1-type n=1 Tax=Dehalobacter sp. DCM TaxID=2907827 RepID=UPI00308158A4|nr:calcium-transporting P-type ATPase, PMR1-type [Dehalobacter sp. DCM]